MKPVIIVAMLVVAVFAVTGLDAVKLSPKLFDGLDGTIAVKISGGAVYAPSIKPSGSAGKGLGYHELMFENFDLAVGETASIDFNIKLDSDRPGTGSRGAEGGGGGIVGDWMIVIESTKKDLRVLTIDRTEKADQSESAYYAIFSNVDDGIFTLRVRRAKDELQWHVKGGSINSRASLPYAATAKKLSLGLAISTTPKKGTVYSLSNFEWGSGELPAAPAALVHPLFEHKPEHYHKYDREFPPAKHLVLDSVKEPLTKNEIQGMENYLLEYIMPPNGWMNYYFRRRYVAYLYEWTFEKNGNVKLVDKAIDFANAALDCRNDRYGKYKLSYGGVGPIWPNFKEAEFYGDGSFALVPGAGAFGGLACLSMPVRIIANHPELWEKTREGKTYRQIADELAEAAWETIDYSYDVFRGKDNVLRYPETLQREEWRGEVFIFNRVFPLLTGAIPLAEAYEKLGVHSERVKAIDAVNGAMIDFWQSVVQRREENGKTYINYTYSALRLKYDPDSSEDVGHGSFDSRDFQLFFLSGRYDFTEKDAREMADTVADVVSIGNGDFTARLIGDPNKLERNFTYLSGLEGYVWYARYRPELYEDVIDHILENILSKKGADALIYWEIFKLKESSQMAN